MDEERLIFERIEYDLLQLIPGNVIRQFIFPVLPNGRFVYTAVGIGYPSRMEHRVTELQLQTEDLTESP